MVGCMKILTVKIIIKGKQREINEEENIDLYNLYNLMFWS